MYMMYVLFDSTHTSLRFALPLMLLWHCQELSCCRGWNSYRVVTGFIPLQNAT